MFPVGGIGVMLLGALLAGLVCLLLAGGLRRRLGTITGTSLALLVWSLVVIALVTLIPANGAPGWVSAETRLETCSTDYGGPAPEGFWIFSGGQRLLNTLIFVPSGALVVVVASHWRRPWLTAPVGVALLAAYGVAIELTQLVLARLDRACDVTDMVDNTTGALLGGAAGVVLAMILHPWRSRT